ncbi:hypothetical protein GCM10010415_29880 [Streptomyces atrovirens]
MIAALRTLITDVLVGTAEDMPEERCPLPEDPGATVAIGYGGQGVLHSLVRVTDPIRSASNGPCDHHHGGRVASPSQGLQHRCHVPAAIHLLSGTGSRTPGHPCTHMALWAGRKSHGTRTSLG